MGLLVCGSVKVDFIPPNSAITLKSPFESAAFWDPSNQTNCVKVNSAAAKSVHGLRKMNTSDFGLTFCLYTWAAATWNDHIFEAEAQASLVTGCRTPTLVMKTNFHFSDQLLTCQLCQCIIRTSNLTVAVSPSQRAICKPLTFHYQLRRTALEATRVCYSMWA